MKERLEIRDTAKLNITLRRLCAELRAAYGDFQNTVLLGIQPRGALFASRIHHMMQTMYPDITLPCGYLDITFHRDDFRRHETPLLANENTIHFSLENKQVILADDVLFTGRTIRSAMDAMLTYGRPEAVKLLILVDRSHKRELPIHADFSGFRIDTLDNEKVIVEWQEKHGKDSIRIETRKSN
jgi:pyrimidine operon attenuation protein/uracil phosphoribosyltransferase